MTQCQCLTKNGKGDQCKNEASTKLNQNAMYCWQRQNCQSSINQVIPIKTATNKIPIKIKPVKKVRIQTKVSENKADEQFVPAPPKVVCIKGKQKIWGSDPNDLYIGRNINMGGWKLPKSKWHNPFTLKNYNNDVAQVLQLYRNHVENSPNLIKSLPELTGKNIGCWCKIKGGEPCHGDILVELYKKYVMGQL